MEALNQQDHDLLVELRTEMRGMRTDIKDLKEGTAARLAVLERKAEDLEAHKASKKDLEVTNARSDRMNTRINMFVGGLAVLNALALPLLFYYLSKH